jgi:hypothetical protein
LREARAALTRTAIAKGDRLRPDPSKAMPVVFTNPDEFDRWLCAYRRCAGPERPLPDDALRIVSTREKEDPFSKIA